MSRSQAQFGGVAGCEEASRGAAAAEQQSSRSEAARATGCATVRCGLQLHVMLACPALAAMAGTQARVFSSHGVQGHRGAGWACQS